MSEQEAEAQSFTLTLTPNTGKLRLSAQLSLAGNLATNWFSTCMKKNYEIAARLKDSCNPTINKKLRAGQGKDMDIIFEEFEQYCVGDRNGTYERYRFNKRDQNERETMMHMLHQYAL